MATVKQNNLLWAGTTVILCLVTIGVSMAMVQHDPLADHIPGLAAHSYSTPPVDPLAAWEKPLERRQAKAWPLVMRYARKHGMDPALIMAIIQVESTFRPWAVSHRGAAGMMQINPVTADHLGLEDPLIPAENIEAGVRYLASLKKRFDGDRQLMLAAYNAGPGKVRAAGGVPEIVETRNFVRKVLKTARTFRSQYATMSASN